MPKIRKERVRRHVVAAGLSSPSIENTKEQATAAVAVAKGTEVSNEEKASLLSTGGAIKWEPVKPLDFTAILNAALAEPLPSHLLDNDDADMSDSKNDNDKDKSKSSSSSGEEKKEKEEGKRPLVKKITKKEKIQARHQKFMNRLMLPGDKQKFEPKKLDMSSLAEVIDIKEPAPATQKMTTFTRKAVASSEINQFKLVFQHPSFQQDALAAIREHLTLSNAAKEEEAARAGPTKKKKQTDRSHPYTKPDAKPEKERAPKPTQAAQKPNPNKGKHTRKKGRAETFRKR